MISYELPEILGMSDRVIVMHEGQIVANWMRRTQQRNGHDLRQCQMSEVSE
jgi:ABC-type sugar transport system ATPase subunit